MATGCAARVGVQDGGVEQDTIRFASISRAPLMLGMRAPVDADVTSTTIVGKERGASGQELYNQQCMTYRDGSMAAGADSRALGGLMERSWVMRGDDGRWKIVGGGPRRSIWNGKLDGQGSPGVWR